jgi:glutaconyl-CoA/methylmalonyl-CoA decarboxylase subunit delta
MITILNSIHFDFSNITQHDGIIAIVGYSIVFIALVILFFVFTLIPKIINLNVRNKLIRQGKIKEAEQDCSITGDETAAISMALHLFFNEMHDEEHTIITMKNISRRYSPWSSKIYGVLNIRK